MGGEQLDIHYFLQSDISESIGGSPVSYTIIYSDTNTGQVCHTANISHSDCEEGMCGHVFPLSLSNCDPCADINVTVFATSILGDGPVSDPRTIGNKTYPFY